MIRLPTLKPYNMPAMGVGTYELYGDECVRAVCAALRMGFRLFDTAASYRNEELVGAGIRESGVPREELFIVVKLAMKAMKSEEAVREGILESIRKLGIEYADCVLLHWPGCAGVKSRDQEGNAAARRRCWRAMAALQAEGKVRYMGLSNFLPKHFSEIDDVVSTLNAEASGVATRELPLTPIVNQIELHPLCTQEALVQYCRGRSGPAMVLQQYSPLGKMDPRLVEHPRLVSIVREYFPGDSVADVLLMWGLSQGFCLLVRSRSEAHLRANWDVAVRFFSEELTARQRDILLRLRELMNVEEDVHLFWYSSNVA